MHGATPARNVFFLIKNPSEGFALKKDFRKEVGDTHSKKTYVERQLVKTVD